MRNALTRPFPVLLATAAVAVAAPLGSAADWSHTVTPYLWGSGMSGKTAVGTATPAGPLEADVDVGFDDILSNLKFGAMGSYRGDRSDGWVVMADYIYMSLEADKQSTAGPVRIDTTVGVKQTATDLDVVRTGPGAGANRAASKGDSWTDPVVGVTARYPLNDTWSLGVRGDVGGFGIGSDLTWQMMATVNWKVRDNLEVVAGYRYLDADYEDGSGADLFKYDMVTSGPGIGVSFKF
ncbi:MAG: porin [Xanthomonadales bacterium]|nr:porin [Xanthomonadales bacterium]